MDRSAAADVKATFEQWELYRAIIHNNFMRHAELTRLLDARFRQLPAGVVILDLGSGDGYMAYESLRDVDVVEYHAVDLSAEALRRVTTETPAWEGRRVLHAGSFVDILPSLAGSHFDVVLASYSLHHLTDEETDHVLAQITRLLKPTGWFVWTDSVRGEHESRDEYLRRLEFEIRTHWVGLSPQQQEQAFEHIWSRDFPVTLSVIRSRTAAHGLSECEQVYRDELFGSCVFRRASSD